MTFWIQRENRLCHHDGKEHDQDDDAEVGRLQCGGDY